MAYSKEIKLMEDQDGVVFFECSKGTFLLFEGKFHSKATGDVAVTEKE